MPLNLSFEFSMFSLKRSTSFKTSQWVSFMEFYSFIFPSSRCMSVLSPFNVTSLINKVRTRTYFILETTKCFLSFSISFRCCCHTDEIPHMIMITQTKEHTQNICLDRVWSMLRVICSWKLLLLGQIDVPSLTPSLPHSAQRSHLLPFPVFFFYPL